MNWNQLRDEFPITQNVTYLNHAGVAPISRRVTQALHEYSQAASEFGAFHYARTYDARIEETRTKIATLIGSDMEEIAFAKNTTEGLNFVSNGLQWKPGDRIVTCDLEYPSNIYPWWNLQKQGVETQILESVSGTLPLDLVEEAIRHPKTRLLSLSSVEFGNGFRNDLSALGELCQQHDVLFCVDAIQSLGCLPVNVQKDKIDFLATDGHKWMLSVEGCGFFFCSRRVLDQLHPHSVGWRSVADRYNFDDYQLNLQPNAGKFEEGTPNTTGIFALGAAVDLLLEIGIPSISERILELNQYLWNRILDCGGEITSPGEQPQSGILTFRYREESPEKTVARLRQNNIFTIVRRGSIRVSPHFYNSHEEIDHLIEILSQAK